MTVFLFGDRCHLYISGTASIDPSGQVMFPQNAGKQTVRASIPADIPMIFVEGAVCRPTWHVEVECVALKRQTSAFPAFL